MNFVTKNDVKKLKKNEEKVRIMVFTENFLNDSIKKWRKIKNINRYEYDSVLVTKQLKRKFRFLRRRQFYHCEGFRKRKRLNEGRKRGCYSIRLKNHCLEFNQGGLKSYRRTLSREHIKLSQGHWFFKKGTV